MVLKIIFNFVIWVFVPAILIAALSLIYALSKKIEDKKYKASTRAGFWAGFMLFIIILIYQVSIFIQSGFPDGPIFKGFSILLALAGGIAAFLLNIGGKKIIPPQFGGLVVLGVTFICFYVLFHYLFIGTFNKIILSSILGIVFGTLAHIASSPAFLREFLDFLKTQKS